MQDIKLIMPTVLILLFTIFIMVTVIPYAFSSGMTDINNSKNNQIHPCSVIYSTTANLYYTPKATALQQRPASRGLISRHFLPPPPIFPPFYVPAIFFPPFCFPAILFSAILFSRIFWLSPVHLSFFYIPSCCVQLSSNCKL